jgi:nitrilase
MGDTYRVATALFPGSFDPFHRGHLSIVEWAATTFDEVLVAVLGNPEKQSGLLTRDERVRLAQLCTAHLGNVRCLAFHGVTGDLAKAQKANVIIRSAHKEADLERSLAVLNKFMSGGVPTEFAPSDPATEGISSTAIRDLLATGDLEAARQMVPEAVRAELPSAARVSATEHPGSRSGGAPRPGPMTVGRRVQPLRVAAVQDAPVWLDRDGTLDTTLTLVERAAAEGAQLVVFPEAFLPGYPDWVWRTRPWDDHASALYATLFDNAVVIGSAVTSVLGVAAKRFGIYLSIGIDEREPSGSTLYNSQLLYGPDGSLLSVHRKLVPTGGERLVWGMGDGSGLEVVETPFGRIGTLTCWENYMPLARAALYAQGVDIYLAPTWDNSDVWPSTMQHIAREGRVFVVGVNQCLRATQLPEALPGRAELYGGEEDWLARGNTMIVDADGHLLAGPLTEQAGIVIADIDANEARHLRQQFDSTGHYGRPDVLRLQMDLAPRPSGALRQDSAADSLAPMARGASEPRSPTAS